MVYQIPKAGIANNAIDQFKLEDGAVTTNKIGDSQVTLAKLGSDARRQNVTRLEGSTATLTLTELLSNGNVLVDCSINAKLILLPTSPPSGTWITVSDIKKNSQTNAITIRPAGTNSIDEGVNGVDYVLNKDGISITLVYDNPNANWVIVDIDGDSNIFSTSNNVTLQSEDFCSVTQDNLVLTLPSSPESGDEISVNIAGEFINTTIARNGSQIMGLSEDLIIDIPYITVNLIYVNPTVQWRIK